MRALTLAREYSRVHGSFIGKIFQSEDLDEAREEAVKTFKHVRIARPQATKKQSYEVYVVCQDRRDRADDDGEEEQG